jgi:anaerobilin synthase
LNEEELSSLVGLLRSELTIADDAEWSFEVEAKSMSESKVKLAADLGFTRVSFGVQTLNPNLRKMVNLTASSD